MKATMKAQRRLRAVALVSTAIVLVALVWWLATIMLSPSNPPPNSVRAFFENQVQPRIVGGSPVTIGEFESFVFTAGGLLCGGTLIHPDVVLTAAHCVGAFVDGILIGGIQFNGGDGTFIRVTEEFPHPEYDSETGANDVMVVKLVSASTAPLQVVNYDPNVPDDGAITTVIGYGHIMENGTNPDFLLQTDVDVVSFSLCSGIFGPRIVEDIMLCAGGDGVRDSCQGDSGGPLFTDSGLQVGVVSFGSGCARDGIPAVYARTSGFETWVRQSICNISDVPPDSCSNETLQPTMSPVPSVLPTLVPTPEAMGNNSSMPSSGPTMPSNVTDAPTMQANVTLVPSLSPSMSNNVTDAPTMQANVTLVPSVPPSETPSASSAPTQSQSNATLVPSLDPSMMPSSIATMMPTNATLAPSLIPSSFPSLNPSGIPTVSPIDSSTLSPVTLDPTANPTQSPSALPTLVPSAATTATDSPTPAVTSVDPSTFIPITDMPVSEPSTSPSTTLSENPTAAPTNQPTGTTLSPITEAPLAFPNTLSPTGTASLPTDSLTGAPTAAPSQSPSVFASAPPVTSGPSLEPPLTRFPTVSPKRTPFPTISQDADEPLRRRPLRHGKGKGKGSTKSRKGNNHSKSKTNKRKGKGEKSDSHPEKHFGTIFKNDSASSKPTMMEWVSRLRSASVDIPANEPLLRIVERIHRVRDRKSSDGADR